MKIAVLNSWKNRSVDILCPFPWILAGRMALLCILSLVTWIESQDISYGEHIFFHLRKWATSLVDVRPGKVMIMNYELSVIK